MNKASSIFSKFLACIFASFFALFFLIIICIFLFRSMFTYDNVFKYISEAKVFDSESYEILSSGSSKTLRDAIHKDLLVIGIPESVTDDVLDSKEVNKALTDYIYSYYNYILYNTQRVSFDENKVILTVQNKYLTSQGKTLSDEQLSKFQHYLKSSISKLDSGLFSDSELNEVLNLNIVRMLASALNSSYVILLFEICLILMIVLISICLQSLLRAYRWCSKMICLDGIILVITSLLEVKIFSMFFNSKGIVDNLVISVVENGFTGLLICGIVLVVVGLVLIAISGFLLTRKKTESNKNLANIIAKEADFVTSEIKEVQGDDSENNTSDKDSNLAYSSDSVDNEVDDINNEVNQKQDNTDVDIDNNITEPVFNEDANSKEDSEEDIDNNSNFEDNEEDFSNDTIEPKEEYDTEIVEDSDIDVNEESDSAEEDVSFDAIEIEPVLDSSDIDESVQDTDNISSEETEYTEIFDNDSKEDEIIKKDIKLEPLAEVSPDVIYPEKGKDIEVNLEETEEEEIEVL